MRRIGGWPRRLGKLSSKISFWRRRGICSYRKLWRKRVWLIGLLMRRMKWGRQWKTILLVDLLENRVSTRRKEILTVQVIEQILRVLRNQKSSLFNTCKNPFIDRERKISSSQRFSQEVQRKMKSWIVFCGTASTRPKRNLEIRQIRHLLRNWLKI